MAEVETPEVELTQEQKDAAFAEKYRAQFNGGESSAQVVEDGAGGGDKPQRPADIPEKFWDAEKGEVRVSDLAKSYAELEKAKAKPAEKVIPENETPEQKAEREAAEAAQAASAEEFAKHREAMTTKMLAGQAFDDGDYAPFEKMGLTRDDVDTFAAGLQAIGEMHKARVHEAAGGEKEYAAMIAWARDNFSADEVAAYDRDVYSRDTAVSTNAVKGLAARYREVAGRPGMDVTKGGGSKVVADGFASKAEMVAAMKDPRYAKDAAYRAEVEQKVHAAYRNGVNLSY